MAYRDRADSFDAAPAQRWGPETTRGPARCKNCHMGITLMNGRAGAMR
jgi:hypothetical protein